MDKAESIKMIEKQSCFRCTALTDKGGFFIPADKNNAPMATPEHWTDKKIIKLAEIMKNKPKGD